jgi:choice-of-anchor B domain-containing protein
LAFVDITDPVNPIHLGLLPLHEGANPAVWRDFKVYENHVFVVADGAGPHGMQVFDLTQLRDLPNRPTIFEETAHYDQFGSAHNLVLNEESGYAYAVGVSNGPLSCNGGLHMIDLLEPTRPIFAGCFGDSTIGRGYTHDAQCVLYKGPDLDHQGSEICLGSNEAGLSIVDVTDKSAPLEIGTGFYASFAYAHQGWLTEDHRYFLMDDEVDEQRFGFNTRTIIWDVSDLDNPFVLSEYISENTSSDHNLYISGNLVFQANYASGLRVLDITDINAPREVAFFDTYLADDNPGYRGAWSTYPFYPSGVVTVTSSSEGLFILQPTTLKVLTDQDHLPASFAFAPAYPNPFHTVTTFNLTLATAHPVLLRVYDTLGRPVHTLYDGPLSSGVHRFIFNASGLPGGTYFVRATALSQSLVQVVVLSP